MTLSLGSSMTPCNLTAEVATKKSKIAVPHSNQLQVPQDRSRNLVTVLTEILQISDIKICFKIKRSSREIKKNNILVLRQITVPYIYLADCLRRQGILPTDERVGLIYIYQPFKAP